MSKISPSTGSRQRAATALRAGVRRLRELLVAYIRSRRAGAMLVTGAFVLLTMVVGGSAMSNYAWREAQWEELRAATRAAISAAGPLLAQAGTATGDQQISQRVAEFLSALQPGLVVDASDVTVSRDASGVVTITVRGEYVFDDIWGDWGGGSADAISIAVRASLEVSRYEVAVAADMSASMGERIAGGSTKLQGLKDAFATTTATLEAATRGNPGSMMVSVVPFASAVNVADTCAEAGGSCTNARTAAKERYVRMLAGARNTMALTLADARAAVANDERVHWVDTFRDYGMSRNSPLTHRHLPSDLLNDTDWNLRRTDVNIDVSADIPNMGTWTVDDEDFWYGCVMARWGAYWNPAARPTPFNPGPTTYWPRYAVSSYPAQMAVPAWSPRGMALPATTPLHLSDAPPVATNPNTLFTAFSWPDSRIGTDADMKLQGTMLNAMFPGQFYSNFIDTRAPLLGDNDWSRPGNSGRQMCPPSPISPLTDDMATLRDTVNALDIAPLYEGADGFEMGSTLLVRGMVWGLRTLSPLWQDVWAVSDANGQTRPGVPCVPGEARDCDTHLSKSILLISDGDTFMGRLANASLLRAAEPPDPDNPDWRDASDFCTSANTMSATYGDYFEAANDNTGESRFNQLWRAGTVGANLLEADGTFNSTGAERVAEGVLNMENSSCTADMSRCQRMRNQIGLASVSPWGLFRELDSDMVDVVMGSDFDFTGRPTLIGHICKPRSPFSPYGHIGDLVEVGDEGARAGVAPLHMPDTWVRREVLGAYDMTGFHSYFHRRLNGWLEDACRIAGQRRVRVNAMFIGRPSANASNQLRACVNAAGGDPDRDIYVAPTAQAIRDTVATLFTVRRNLRFFD